MKSQITNLTRVIILSLMIGFLSSCAEDIAFNDLIENIDESPLLENGDDEDDDYRPPKAG